MADVFISYSRRDSEFVAELAAALEARGKEPWVDVRGITDGEVFPDALRRAIEESDGLIFVVSEESATSRFCRQEIDHAEQLGKRIVPVVHRRVASSGGLRSSTISSCSIARANRGVPSSPRVMRPYVKS